MEDSKIESFEQYLHNNENAILNVSNRFYSDRPDMSTVMFSFDYNPFYQEVCFARMYDQIKDYGGRKFSSNYFLRLPYKRSDNNPELHTYCVDYTNFFAQLQNLVYDVYEIKVYNTIANNVKMVTMVDKLNMSLDFHYTLSLVLFTMLRGIEGEYNPLLINNYSNSPLTGDMREYIHSISKRSRGSHHNINDSLDRLINSQYLAENIKHRISDFFVNTLETSFGKDGLVHHPHYKKYFKESFKKKVYGYGHPMQTKCFSFINETVNKIVKEGI